MRRTGMRASSPGLRFVTVCLVLLLAPAGLAGSEDLFGAIKRGDRQAVRALLRKKVNINARQGDGATALAWAVHRDDYETAALLIRSGADVNLATDFGVTPLALACDNGNSRLVDRLLAAGANPNLAYTTGLTPLMICTDNGAVDGARSLLVRGANPNAKEKESGQTAMMWAAATGRAPIVRVLTEHGGRVNDRSDYQDEPEPFIVKPSTSAYETNYPPTVRFRERSGGFTPILFAARNGDVATAAALLAVGADINDATPDDGSALMIAIASGHEKLAMFLLEKGANPKASDAWGITPLHYALHRGLLNMAGEKKGRTDRFGWDRQNMPNLVTALLAKGADVNARIKHSLPFLDQTFIARTTDAFHQADITGATPFLLATASGDVTMMRVLLEAGADPHVETYDGATAVLLAAGLGTERGKGREEDYVEAAKLALSLGLDVNHAKDDKRTPLHAAVVHGWAKMVELLVAHGANLEAKDTWGQTALTIAMGDPEDRMYRPLPGATMDLRFRPVGKNPKIAELLLALGAAPFTGKFADKSGR